MKTIVELKAYYTPNGHPTCVDVKGKTIDKRAIDAAIDELDLVAKSGKENLTPAQIVLLYLLDPYS